jgi:raffinose/stachyose/melibiose transport system substrate-binding protein
MLGLAASLPVSMALAGCSGTSGPGGGDGGASYWFLSGQPQEGIRAGAVERFNKANPDTTIDTTTFQNDAYKTRIKTAIGANQAPTIIWGWGGGTLRTYVEAGQVEDLTSWFNENSAVKDKLIASSFGPATINDKIYAMPCETVEPIVLYYNNRVFDRFNLQPPTSWEDVMPLVRTFTQNGITPFALAGQSRWTNMMWLEFLFDRIGGPEVFQAAFDGEKDAWSHPDSIRALTVVQELAEANAFGTGFASITADSNADQALLYQDQAAMMLHGAWSYGIQKANAADFVSSGGLGYMNFPPVENGKGDPSNTVGNPGQYLSISSRASDEQKETAKKFFSTGVLDDEEVKGWIDSGAVPILKGTQEQLAANPNADFVSFLYQTADEAQVFGQSWDQALDPTAAETLLDNISRLFLRSISPEEFASALNEATAK